MQSPPPSVAVAASVAATVDEALWAGAVLALSHSTQLQPRSPPLLALHTCPLLQLRPSLQLGEALRLQPWGQPCDWPTQPLLAARPLSPRWGAKVSSGPCPLRLPGVQPRHSL